MKLFFFCFSYFICTCIFSFEFGTSSYYGSWSIFQKDGVTFTDEDIQHLPVGSNLSSLLEYWYLPSVVYNPDLAGFAATESPKINTHASSSLWQNFWINGTINNDLNEPGKPFIDVPLKLTEKLKVKSVITSYANQKGYSWDLKNTQRESFANVSLNTHIGGVTFIPGMSLDREPAQAWGAPTKTRRFRPSPEISFLFKTHSNNLIFSEILYHERDFLSSSSPEKSFKVSNFYIHHLPKIGDLLIAYQARIREADGLERNFVKDNTQKGSEHNILFIFDFYNKKGWDIKFNFGLGLDFWEDQGKPYSYELTREINFAQQPVLPHHAISSFSEVVVKNEELLTLTALKSKLGFYNSTQVHLLFEKVNLSHSFIQRFEGLNSLEVILFDPFQYSSNILAKNQSAFYLKTKIKRFELHTEIGFLLEGLFHQKATALWGARPNANIKGNIEFGSKINHFDFLFGIQHEAIPITMTEARFLNPNGISGTRQRWNDANNNGQYDAGEEQGILNRTGAQYHQVKSDFELPSIEELHLGFRYKFKKILEVGLYATLSVHRNLYWVSFPTDFEHGYVPVTQDGHTIYDRIPGTYGQEIYELSNNPKDAYFATLELQILKTKFKDIWFLNVSVGAYINLINASPGNTVFTNDIGVYGENLADPNHNINTLGRSDYDRGYLVNIIVGLEVIKNFVWSNVFRYRDGAPLGLYTIARGLQQGPTPILNVLRAQGLEGMGRYTFYFTWDMKIQYRIKGFEITLDIYNLLYSSTELIENHFPGRNAIEGSIPRSIKISVGYYW